MFLQITPWLQGCRMKNLPASSPRSKCSRHLQEARGSPEDPGWPVFSNISAAKLLSGKATLTHSGTSLIRRTERRYSRSSTLEQHLQIRRSNKVGLTSH